MTGVEFLIKGIFRLLDNSIKKLGLKETTFGARCSRVNTPREIQTLQKNHQDNNLQIRFQIK